MIDALKFISDAGKNLPNGLVAIDLACGNGWLGKYLLDNNFVNYIKFADARTDWFDKGNLSNKAANFEFLNFDIEDAKLLEKALVDCNLVIYFGHLYHSCNPEKILDLICKSQAQYLLIESKVHDIDIGLSKDPIIYSCKESSTQYYNAYNSTGKTVWVKRPNLAFTKKFLEKNGWTISNCVDAVQKITLPDHTHTFDAHCYLIFATRDKSS